MPKRNSQVSTKPWKHDRDESGRYYYEHDDRAADTTRKVSLLNKNRISKHAGRKRDADGPSALLGDDDVEMVAAALVAKGGRFKNFKGGPGPSGGGRGPRGPRGGGRHVQIATGPSHFINPDTARWHRIVIPHGSKYDKSFILSVIMSYIAPVTFVPYCYRVGHRESSFFVDDLKIANVLLKAHQKITVNDGFRLSIRTQPGAPNTPLDESFKQKVLVALQGRLNKATNALDLRSFRSDPNLIDEFVLLMFRPPVLSVIVDLILQHMPDIVGLNLTDNQLHALEALEQLVKRAPQLKVLHLAKNKLRDVRRLDCLKGMKLEELFLDGNPLCDRFNQEEVYVSEIRKRFPNVVRLDGAELPAPIKFDVAEPIKLPPPQASFMINPEAEAVAKRFLQQYYEIYDSEDRQPLTDAYHENASFSMTVMMPKSEGNHRLGHYLQESRNLLRIQDIQRRVKYLSSGKPAVVSTLSRLTKTKHDLNSFTVDLPVFNAQLGFLSVSGMFSEPKMANAPVRHFSRTFVIVPQGVGFVIINDLLLITNATDKQLKPTPMPTPGPSVIHMPTPVVTPISTPVGTPVMSPVTSPGQVVASPIVPDDVKEQMVMAMCQQTSMNVLWARKCLEENHWDFNAAVRVFTQLHSAQKVPPDAFVQ